ncbi:MAG: type II toxin-antitoxin system VapC family toxin [Beijerinckiaceae bacterium]|nr:type II toxin-antitoxin system VapC family toxin [Beijerinckiaceae bacterium]
MFIDTSAIIAVLLKEPEAGRISRAIERVANCLTSPHVRLETCMVLTTRLDVSPSEAERGFDRFLSDTRTLMCEINDDLGRLAVDAFARYGKGRGHPAQLNLADCLSYACARAHGLPILFKGRDFSLTDLSVVDY